AALAPRPRLAAADAPTAQRRATAARQPVATRPAPQLAVKAASAAHAAPSAAPGAAPDVAGPACPRCGHANRAGARFCARDGAPLTPAARGARRAGGAL